MNDGLATCRAITRQAQDVVGLAASEDGQRLGPGGRYGRARPFCLVEPGDGETERGFAALEVLLAYLRWELEAGWAATAIRRVKFNATR
jgi:hypothetical protein